jgi:hypothetical protein
MKRLLIAALLLAVPSLGAGSQATSISATIIFE